MLRLDSDDGDERSELRDDRLDPTDEGGEILRILYKDAFSRCSAKSSMPGEAE